MDPTTRRERVRALLEAPPTPLALALDLDATFNERLGLKRCSTCEVWREPDEFHRDKSKKDGRRGRCRDCESEARPDRAEYMRAYHAENREERPRRLCADCETPLAHGTRKRFCDECRARKSRDRRNRVRTGTGWHGFAPKAVECAECRGTFTAHRPGAKFCSDLCRNRQRERERPSMAERGYGRDHFRLRKAWAPRVAAGTVACARCGELIAPGERWDLDHDDNDRSAYLGPSHARCNRATSRHRAERERGLVTSRDW